MSWNYSEKTTQLFMDAVHGKPGTHLGEIENPDGFGEHGSIACGDALRFTFRVEKGHTDPSQDKIVVLPDGTLVNAFFRTIVDPQAGGTTVGIEQAIFRSYDQGQHWERLDLFGFWWFRKRHVRLRFDLD